MDASPESETERLVGASSASRPFSAASSGDVDSKRPRRLLDIVSEPYRWIRMLCFELHATFVLGVLLVNGLSQGFAGSLFRVVADYYWKDVQKVQPSSVQFFSVFYFIPWVLKPLWGILTDVFPFYGYRRRPYFVFAGLVGVISAFVLAGVGGLSVVSAVLCLVVFSAAIAIADVTIDACIARNSIDKPSLAPDIQSLSGFSSSLGALLGFSTSGLFLHHLGPQGSLSVLAFPATGLVVLGFVIYESRTNQPSERAKVREKLSTAVRGMSRTMVYPAVWKPSLFMFLAFSLNISINEGQFYWFTDKSNGNPGFSQEFVGLIYAIGATASMAGVIVYHKFLKARPFRSVLFYAQLLFFVSGMLDLAFVVRWNKKLGIPDYVFVVIEECFSRAISRVRWMPMMVMSTKLCPLGIEGTFFALLMCIDSIGMLLSKSGGAIVLHNLGITRTDFSNLWLAVSIRNLLRFSTLFLVFLVPNVDQTDILIPQDAADAVFSSPASDGRGDKSAVQLEPMVTEVDDV